MSGLRRVYLAGPEVFLADAAAVGEAKKALCRARGIDGVFPLDGGLDLAGLSPEAAALAILRANESLIRGAAAVLANMTPFRGPHMDPGTAYELGYARALGLPVFGYSAVRTGMPVRVAAAHGPLQPHPDGGWADRDGLLVEDFGWPENLMPAGAVVEGGHPVVLPPYPVRDPWRDLTPFAACLDVMCAVLAR